MIIVCITGIVTVILAVSFVAVVAVITDITIFLNIRCIMVQSSQKQGNY